MTQFSGSHGWQSRFRVLQMFSSAILGQVLLSGSSFLVGMLLIRHTSDADYGLFVLIQSSLLLLTTAQSSWLSGPLAIIAPKKSDEVKQAMVGAVEIAQRRFSFRLALILLLGPVILYFGKVWDGYVATVVGIAVIAGCAALLREYIRRVLLIYSRVHTLLFVDAVYAAIFVIGAIVAVIWPTGSMIWVTLGLTLAGLVCARLGYRALGQEPGWVSGDASEYLRDIRRLGIWASLGALSYWLFSQSYNYILATFLDLKAVADVNAARLLIMPAIVLTLGIEGLLIPKAAGWLKSAGLKLMMQRMFYITLGLAFVELFYFVLVWMFRDWLCTDLLHKSINERDYLLLLWSAIAMLGLIRIIVQIVLATLEPLKIMACITTGGSVLALGLMWYGITHWSAKGVLMGQAAGDTFVLFCFFVLLFKLCKNRNYE